MPGTPATNNGLERKNRVLKDHQEHRRLLFDLFMVQVISVLTFEASEGVARPVALTPTLKPADWRGSQVHAQPTQPAMFVHHASCANFNGAPRVIHRIVHQCSQVVNHTYCTGAHRVIRHTYDGARRVIHPTSTVPVLTASYTA